MLIGIRLKASPQLLAMLATLKQRTASGVANIRIARVLRWHVLKKRHFAGPLQQLPYLLNERDNITRGEPCIAQMVPGPQIEQCPFPIIWLST
jgi:hypothetical protein